MPSSVSKVPGEVCRGSNSRTCPSLVGMATNAENDLVCLGKGRGVASLLMGIEEGKRNEPRWLVAGIGGS